MSIQELSICERVKGGFFPPFFSRNLTVAFFSLLSCNSHSTVCTEVNEIRNYHIGVLIQNVSKFLCSKSTSMYLAAC